MKPGAGSQKNTKDADLRAGARGGGVQPACQFEERELIQSQCHLKDQGTAVVFNGLLSLTAGCDCLAANGA